MTRLAQFIRDNIEPILAEWETFARGVPQDEPMDVAALRDHAKEMLRVIADDLDRPQTRPQQAQKARGESDAGEQTSRTAAQEHGAGRAERGFTIEQMVSEFRALRASVIHLWSRMEPLTTGDLQDMIRFNEAIDQAIAESITTYTRDVKQSKDRFLAILGHDLRTPLGAIITSTRFVLDTGDLKEPHLSLITRAESTARRMNRLVGDLLEFTRTRFGDGIPIVVAEMDAGRMIHDVAAEVRASYPTSLVNVRCTGDVRGRWDNERLAQAITNLVSNAVQHGAKDAPVDIEVTGKSNGVTISVRNQGPAIPASQMPNLFEGMKQVGPTAQRDRRHFGLGLYIVDKIIRAHRGTINVHSSPEQTSFDVWLPSS